MDNNETYLAIVEELRNRVNAGMLTIEDAELLNDKAYEKYVGEETTEDFADTINDIDEYLTEAKANCQKVADGETVIGADAKSDAKSVVGEKPVNKTPIQAKESNADPSQGLDSKKLASDITANIEVGDSENEDIVTGVKKLRLRVFEAFDAGYISEEDKNLMLEDLNLDNYEIAEDDFEEYFLLQLNK